MRLKLISCEVLTREMEAVAARSQHVVDREMLPMGLHDLGAQMRPHLQERIDAADGAGYDAILLGYALCGKGTEELHAGKTQLVLPRAHDCIGLLMGSHRRYEAYFEQHPGVYYRSPGWIEFQQQGQLLDQVYSSRGSVLGERRSREELIAQYGEENGIYLYEQFNSFRQHYSGLTYIATGVSTDAFCREQARAEAAKEGWAFEEIQGSLAIFERMVRGEWRPEEFLVVPPGAAIRISPGDEIVKAE